MPLGPQISPDGKPASEAPTDDFDRFTNRDKERAIMRARVDAPLGSPLPILMFYGVAGQGKSWLLRKLRDQSSSIKDLPIAKLDFSGNSSRLRNQWLHAIARQMHVPTPRISFALATLESLALESGAQTRASDSEAGDLIETLVADLLGLVDEVPVAGFFVKAIRQIGARFVAPADIDRFSKVFS